MCTPPVASSWILSRRWLSRLRGRCASGCRSGGRPGWALVVTAHAVGGSAAGLRRAQKEELEEVLGKPPSEAGVRAEFWGACGSLRTSCLIRFGARYGSGSS